MIRSELPHPETTRWQPLRSGLLNLYRYDEQEFHFSKGRLLLRGNNGTGKSRVLALQFPFLLDGEMASHRVEPDADRAKRMSWNVLTDAHENRTGYSWLEFGRLNEAGEAETITLGCGFHGVKNRPLKRWFFVTPQRVGDDLFLRTSDHLVLTKEQLRHALDERGTLYEAVHEYRQAVNDALFHMPRERYEALLELLIQLRQPQLSRQLDEQRLSEALANSLAPLDPALINQVADSFRQIEEDRESLRLDERASAAVVRFRKIYADYATAAAAQKANALRDAHNAFDLVSREVKEVAERLEKAVAERERLSGKVVQGEQELEGLRGSEKALRTDPAMKTADRLDQLRNNLADARDRAVEREAERKSAIQERQERENRLEDLKEDITREEKASDQLKGDVFEMAEPLGVDGSAFTELDAKAFTAKSEKVIEGKRQAVKLLKELDARQKEALRHVQHAQQSVVMQRKRMEESYEEADTHQKALQEERNTHLNDLVEWLDAVKELPVTGKEALLEAQSEWSETFSFAEPLTVAVQEAHNTHREHCARLQAEIEQQQAGLQKQVEELKAEQTRLETGEDRVPPVPYTRKEGCRDGREGIPFWRAVDFTADVSEEERGGLEAALEASGILDAWLSSEGVLRRENDGEVLLDIHEVPVVSGPKLSDVIQPDPAAGSLTVAEEVLARIGFGENAGPLWVDGSGNWRNGLLTGQWGKARAEYIGAASREEARKRRLEELLGELAIVQQEQEKTEARRSALFERVAQARREVEARPSTEKLLEEERGLRLAQEQLEKERNRLAEAEEELQLRKQEHETTLAEGIRCAEDLGLVAWRDQLDALSEAVSRFALRLQKWGNVLDSLRRVQTNAQTAERDLERAAAREEEVEKWWTQTVSEVEKLKNEYETLYATAGKSVREIQARLEETRKRMGALGTELNDLRAAREKANEARVKEETRHEDLLLKQEETSALRTQALDAFAVFVKLGLLSEADLDEGHSPEEMAGWSMSRMVEFVRAMMRAVGARGDEEDLDRTQNTLTRGFQDLQTTLSLRNARPVYDLRHGVSLITCEFQNRQCGMKELQRGLEREVLERKKILDARETEFIETYLIGEVADKLHRLIGDARELIRNMNTEIEHCATSTGMRLRLKWAAADGGPAGLKQAEETLSRNQTLLTPAERKKIGNFLRERIEHEKRENEEGTWVEHLERAVDYRRWHTFSIEREQNGKWTRLTRRSHGTGSGGEKALLLTIPQFAAAAAHYHSIPHAPRLIMLDEAFVGIDSEMRGKCMGLIRHFDLDVVMTSEREWGCYDSIDGLSICQLAAHPDSPVVAVSHWRWNGRVKESLTVESQPPPAVEKDGEPEEELFG